MQRVLRFPLPAACVFCLMVGCGGGSDKWVEDREEVYPVSGKVTFNGEPLEGAVVMFRSEAKQLTAHGKTDDQGQYRLTTYETADGAVPGEHTVCVRKTEYETVPSRNSTPDEPATQSIGKEILPKEYATPSTSPLKKTVTEDEAANSFDFEF